MYNPLSDKLMPWRIAQFRRAVVSLITLPIQISTDLLNKAFSGK